MPARVLLLAGRQGPRRGALLALLRREPRRDLEREPANHLLHRALALCLRDDAELEGRAAWDACADIRGRTVIRR